MSSLPLRLAPINQLRSRLTAVHKGAAARAGGAYPAEAQPLVDDLNALIEERERRVARAVAKAGDLAHGLKTPLAVLAHEARRARATGQEQLASEIDQQIDRMRRRIDYHLAHARSAASAASPGARASIAASADSSARLSGCMPNETSASKSMRLHHMHVGGGEKTSTRYSATCSIMLANGRAPGSGSPARRKANRL